MSQRPPATEIPPRIYGVMAEFEQPDALLDATWRARQAGYRRMDAYTPFPVEGEADALGMHRSLVPWLVAGAGLTGGLTGTLLTIWAMAFAYPINVGGRPYVSIPSFVPPAYELTILFSALMAVFSLFFLCKLPEPYHPVFNVPSFSRATVDRFFLLIQADDPRFDPRRTTEFLRSLEPLEVVDVPE